MIAWVFTFGANAQEEGLNFSVGADLVSSYIWRGTYQTGFSVQPGVGLEVSGFSVSAWSSTDLFGGGFKEVDFTLGYSISGISLAITDYWWAGEGAYKYFNYKKETTDHLWEATIGYTLPVTSFPLSLSLNTFFTGNDAVKLNGKRAYSTYIEADFPFSVKSVNLDAIVGMTPGEGLYATGASVVNLSLKASKELKITDNFSLPVFGQIIANPRLEDIYFIFGITF